MKRTVILGLLALAGWSAANAGTVQGDLAVYKPSQGINQKFGSKVLVGYFLQRDGACAVSLFLGENAEDGGATSAPRVQVNVPAGDTLKFGTAEGHALHIRCGEAATTLEVKKLAAPEKLASR
jgi:hypothetical protein